MSEELPENIREYFSKNGQKGGKAKGECKRRDQKDPNFYSRIGKMKKKKLDTDTK